MQFIDLIKEIATLAGYTVTGSSGADPLNKTRAQRRLNSIKTDVISRYGGRWPSQYREGWLPLVPVYTTGTITATLGSRTITGAGTLWLSNSAFIKAKILIGGAYYKIASVTDDTTLILTQPYQSSTASGMSYQIWVDEYRLYPEVLSIGGFLDYQWQSTMSETYPRNMKQSYPLPQSNELPTVYTVIGRKDMTVYSTGTVTGTISTNTLTGSGTSWLGNLEPGMEITIGSYTYHVRSIESDTALTLYQYLVVSLSAGTSYSAKGKNCLIVRFREPTTQRVVHYWYWAKSYPLVNDSDEDWIAEIYSEVLLAGAVTKDYMDKNDLARLSSSKNMYEDNIKNMKVSEDNAMTGVRTLGYDIPPEARD